MQKAEFAEEYYTMHKKNLSGESPKSLAEFRSFDGVRISAHDGSFDLIFAACVFHHIRHCAQYFVLATRGTDA